MKILIALVCVLTTLASVSAGGRTLKTDSLKVEICEDGSAFSVTDLRTGRTWRPVGNMLRKDSRLQLEYELNGDEIVVSIASSADDAMPWMTYSPAPLDVRKDDWLIVPRGEGLRYPVNEDNPGLICGWTWQTGSAGLVMPFSGVAESRGEGAGYMIVVDTPDDGGLYYARTRLGERLWTMSPVWTNVRGKFGYVRRVRYIFFPSGGYVSMAKRYREIALRQGLVKTLAEKAKSRPNVAKLAGAADIWWWDRGDRAKVAEELRTAGMNRLLFCNVQSFTSNEVKRIAKMPDVLVGRYDIYQDVYRPEIVSALNAKPTAWLPGRDAWPHDCVWSNRTADSWIAGWKVRTRDGRLMPCAVMCDLCAPLYMEKYVSSDLKTHPYTARFIDTTTTVPLRECENPLHPMTRTECRNARVKLLQTVQTRWNLVTGSEVGASWAVPYCDYFEGMLSPGNYRIKNAGRDVQVPCNEWPDHVERYGLNPKYRIPLWELVFHDCVQSTWFWGDYNNKMPELWKRRDLFNALWGTMPMYIMDKDRWASDRDRFVSSFRLVSPIQRDTAMHEMTSHRTLSDDFNVQRSEFADGTSVTVDFAKKSCSVKRNSHVRDYCLADGVVPGKLVEYVRKFNELDDELYANEIPNSESEAFLLKNVPLFECPDADIERTYYFRWWTFRKHLRHNLGLWTITEFLPPVPWAGEGNTIVCPAGHHLREARWLRDPKYVMDCAKFWLADSRSAHRWGYASWLFTGTCLASNVTGDDSLPAELLDAAVRYYEGWEHGFDRRRWGAPGTAHIGGDGMGGFLSIDNYEGSEASLGGDGYKPLFASAMWSEAMSIATVASRLGRNDLARMYEAKAESNRQSIMTNCWNEDLLFFTTASGCGRKGLVRELHGYAPWYFGMPTDGRMPDWRQLTDRQGFAAKFGLTFPERRASGFRLSYEGHECQWNGPSWPFATSIALTALANDLHSKKTVSDTARKTYTSLLHQYAAAHKRMRDDGVVVPWIDENINPDTGDWMSRTILKQSRKAHPSTGKYVAERGKDYNHSTFCDLVISGLVGFIPMGNDGFAVNPLCPREWDCFSLDNLRYRGHNVSIRWKRGEGMVVIVDDEIVARSNRLTRLSIRLSAKESVSPHR